MKCDLCPNPAKVFFSQILGSKIQKVNLCEACAEAQGVTDPTGFALADVLQGVGTEKPIERSAPRGALTCPRCGFTRSDFKKTGRLGCSACYQIFEEGIHTVLGSMHRGTTHKGKIPTNFTPEDTTIGTIAELTERLDNAINNENYEEAARIRDEIQQLQKLG